MQPKEETVNSPIHYNKWGKKECIVEQREFFGVLPVLFFCLLNLYKYEYRKGLKNDGTTNEEQDQQKANWYLNYSYNIIVRYWWVKIVLCLFFKRTYQYIMDKNKIQD